MESKSAVKVGVLVLLAFVLAAGAYYYLSGINLNTYTVRVHFKDTRGLLKQSVVRLKGVAIGDVQDVKLEQSNGTLVPTVTLAIKKQYEIPTTYQFVIASGLLITNPTIEVRPPADAQGAQNQTAPAEPGVIHTLPQDGSAVVEGGEAASALSSIDPQLSQTVANLNSSFTNLNAKLGTSFTKLNTLLDKTNRLVDNSNDTMTRGKNLIADPRLKNNLLEITENFKQLSITTRKTTDNLSRNLNDIINSSKGRLNKLTDQGLALFTKLGNTVDDANNVVRKLTEQVSDPRLQSSLQETIELARSTLSSSRQIASDIHQLTGDPTLQANLKESAVNLKLTTERSAAALEKLNNILGKFTNAADKARAPKVPPIQLLVDAQESVDPARFRLDVDARVPIGNHNLIDFGLYDFGDNTRLNLQGGTKITDNLLARYGLHASKLGVGLEYGLFPYSGLRADLYDANHPRLDVKGLIRVKKNVSIWAGADGIFRGDPVPTIGVQLNN